MGCNCKTIKTVNTINELYGDGKKDVKINLNTILLRLLFLIMVIARSPLFLIYIIFRGIFSNKPIDIRKILKLKHV